MAQKVKNLLAMWETQVWFLAQEDPQRREWQPIPAFLPGKFHGQRSLAGYCPWGHKELHITERLYFHFHFSYPLMLKWALFRFFLSTSVLFPPFISNSPASRLLGCKQAELGQKELGLAL